MSLSEELITFSVLAGLEEADEITVMVNEATHTVVVSSPNRPKDLVFEGVETCCLRHFVRSQDNANIYFRSRTNA